MSRTRCLLALSLFHAWLFPTGVVQAQPTEVSVTPPDHARFLAGQRFDLRVEGRGNGPFSAAFSIDGVAQHFSSGAQNSLETDGITSPSYGGFNLRGYSSTAPGTHAIEATFSDATGSVTVRSTFRVVDASGARKPARNVIILLGDGMGTAHRTAARLVRFGVTGGDPNGFLAMDRFPAIGMVTTHSLDSVVTDSSPGMAAYSTGTHSRDGQQGVYPAHMVSPFYYPRVEYMAEYLHRTQGKSLGLVTTADLEDATPAANAVHTGSRTAGTGIVDQYLDESDAGSANSSGTGLRVLLGGGRRWFLPAKQFGSSRTDSTDYAPLPPDLVRGWGLSASSAGAIDPERDLLMDFRKAGFTYVDNATALGALPKEQKTPAKLLGLFAYGNMNVALDKLAKRRHALMPGATTFAVDDYHAPDQPMLDEMTTTALQVLSHSNPHGFVLMVEGASIDKQSHAMDAERAIDETIEFDRAVAVARTFAEKIDPSTLVIVVADHECAGLSILGALNGKVETLKALAPDGAATDPHTTPGRQHAVATYSVAGFPSYHILQDGYPETFDVDGKLLFGFGANGNRYETWLTKPRPVLDSSIPTAIQAELSASGYPAAPHAEQQRDGFFVRGQAVGDSQAVHTASDVPISAYASRAALAAQFVGVQRNIDVFLELMRAALGGY